MTDTKDLEAGLAAIAWQVQRWLDWNKENRDKQSLVTEDGTAIMALPVPVWPNHASLQAWIACFKEAADALAQLRREKEELEARIENAEDVLKRSGFVRCDVSACNCNSWHQVGGYRARFDEIKEVVEDAGYSCNGRLFRDVIKEALPSASSPSPREDIGTSFIKSVRAGEQPMFSIDPRNLALAFDPMPLSSKPGAKMRFTGYGGYSSDQEYARRFLNVGSIYTVKSTNVGDWSSTVEFDEFPGKRFNTVMFASAIRQDTGSGRG